ncbi:MAG: hypothetical protein ACR2QC_07785 [Gammaproteobacteria bacterium]
MTKVVAQTNDDIHKIWREIEDMLIRILPEHAEQISLLMDDEKFQGLLLSAAAQNFNADQTKRLVTNVLILRGMIH